MRHQLRSHPHLHLRSSSMASPSPKKVPCSARLLPCLLGLTDLSSYAVRVLVPIVAGTEPVEAFVPISVLRRSGADVTVASAGDGLLVEAMYGVRAVADALVVDCAAASYDLIVLPGGVPGAENLGGCAALESIARRHAAEGGLYAAICAAPPLALASWGLLNGLKATAHPLFVCKFPPEVTAVEANVVVDGNAVTSRGPATSMEFALALVEQLYGKGKAEQIATQMLVSSEASHAMKEVNSAEWRCSRTRMPKVLVPVADGTDEIDAVVIVDALRRAGADVAVASAKDGVQIVARYGTRVVADMTLDAAAASAADQTRFDLIVMPGAETPDSRENLVALLKSRMVVDGNLVMSRSPGTAMEFAVAVVEKLLGREEARQVAEGLLFA